ncbi:aldehyde dehydrogenase family protein [Ensifer adhaerens]|uniref:aldehyde dehydrogenase family protein n=1 Tax=Ensifer adhaerens TaxID=106592 RepID=UPI001CBBFD57|nr:aldehyde dehydrogenase family protein [Ensifer adhaerens]MBZ7926241.1 aldehyde dehydrogenase family protein [Ensifer adhaerens]UAX97396.1 aldehyde dehydrogenase family protein [Ensifer adhaerens]UAY03485.1 aldehyde dehydrogenase family protein [Ensifer adhaerens]UAY11469.1 aldehyde dehydrogenase family protein [Ensifer adhaerens]
MDTTPDRRWHRIAEALRPETRLLIDGQFRAAADGETLASINPANGTVIARVACANAADIETACEVAAKRFRQGVWSRIALRRRIDVLTRFSELIADNREILAVLDTMEMGKPIAEMCAIDVPGAVLTMRFMAESIDKIAGSAPVTNPDALHYILRQPLGVVGCITPWNYPLMMAVWKIAPALAAGNSVVLKPAEDTSLSALMLGRLFLEAGGPDGVFNVVPGRGAVAGQALARSMQVEKIAFTGSTAIGRQMYRYAADSNLKAVSAELGGKSPQIVLADVEDLSSVAEKVADGLFGNQGEVCSAGSRILVERSIHDEFCELIAGHASRKYRPGDPLDPSTTMGPLVNKVHQGRVLDYIDGARKDGATPVIGGHAGDRTADEACFVEPTLFAGVDNRMKIAQEEIFGPVGAIIPHDSPEDVVRIANDSPYGLAAGIWTSNLGKAHRIARDLECGMVWINGYMNGDMSQPWGGWKLSGHGRDKCLEALIDNTQSKSVWVTLD